MPCSVLLPVYQGDDPDFLGQALDSLVEQTAQPGEVVLVNDGPLTEAQEDTIRFNESRLLIRRCGNESNQGLAASLNLGLSHCQFEYVARMDADDLCAPERLEQQLKFMQANSRVDIVGTFVMEIDNKGAKGAIRKMPPQHNELLSKLWTCPLLHPTVMFRKALIESVGGYDPSLRRRQDYELWFRCAQHGATFANIPQVLFYYRFDRNALKKQPPLLALQQGRIGYQGTSALGLAYWKRLACFAPFVRSLLPGRFEHWVYRLMQRFDPRT